MKLCGGRIMGLVLIGALYLANPLVFAGPAEEYHNRGYGFHQQDEFKQAIADYTKAIELDPGYAEAYYHRSRAYFDNSEYDKAWQDLYKAKELGYEFESDSYLETLKKESGRQK